MHIKNNSIPAGPGPDPTLSSTLQPSEQHTKTPIPAPTKPPTYAKHLYFAYGSNLSPTQMKSRCRINPTHSATPLAIATLPKWRWLICEAGYANVLSPSGLRVPTQDSDTAHEIPVSGDKDAVYGVLYQMDLEDELILDAYEGVDGLAGDADPDCGVPVTVRPKVQGDGSYNKWYSEAEVVRWLDGAEGVREGLGIDGGSVPVLVYVDENCVRLAEPRFEYIARMNRAIRESVALGVPRSWVDQVMRKFIPE
ncbi:uncharacterized protein N7515_009116 [Penicillium bovifimosum]|uniref:gamma-glutamylcyclotransferase n=1 Tax=Penicillium bovifimosum TaxID=126998 RepID=A0A9W9GIN6_9EURO|nr:uncharacterized protein N7515_009116 [Penicillium bovifimosum]KAJ5121155.1 hypothetical protein N7515_009116 [Penicillium bovifimosum]